MMQGDPTSPPPAQAETNGLAIASLVFGILSLLTCALFAPLGWYMGVRAGRQVHSSGQQGAGIARAGVIISMFGTALLVIGLVVGAVLWIAVIRDDAPDRASVPARAEQSPRTEGNVAGSLEGRWVVVQADDVFVGYRIQELFGGETITKTGVGRTPAVSGSLTIVGDKVTAAEVTADLSELSSDSGQRDNFIRDSALETNQFTTATFRLTRSIPLPTPVEVGRTIDVMATGDLTLHGETHTVQMALQASWNGSTISVAGGTHIVLADYGIEPPDIALVKVESEGQLELQLVFGR